MSKIDDGLGNATVEGGYKGNQNRQTGAFVSVNDTVCAKSPSKPFQTALEALTDHLVKVSGMPEEEAQREAIFAVGFFRALLKAREATGGQAEERTR